MLAIFFGDFMTDFSPQAGADDTGEVYSTGIQSPTGTPITVRATSGDWRLAGVRFPLTGVNQGDTILTASLSLYFNPASRDDIRCDVYGELVTNPGQFTTTSYHLSDRMDANPTTASVEWQSTGTGAGTYTSPSIVSVIQELVNQASWPDEGNIVLFLDPRSYTSGEFAFANAYEAGSNIPVLSLTWSAGNLPPTIALNTADSATMTTTQPTVEATGDDPDADGLRYNFQITDNPTDFTGGSVVKSSLITGDGTTIHPQPTGGTTWEGKNQIDDRFAFSFLGGGGLVDSVEIYFGTDQVGDTDGTYLVRIYNASGVGVNPVPAVWAASTAYSVDDLVRPDSTANANLHLLYKCKVAGTSGGTEPSWPGNGVLWTTVSEGTEVSDNTVTWEVVYPSYPTSPADPADTPTPGWIAQSETYSYNPGTTDLGFKTCSFTGANRVRLVKDQWYIAVLDWWPNDTVTTNVLAIHTADLGDATAAGVLYLDGSSTNNNGPRIIGDALHRVNESFVLLDKTSGTDAGFANTVTPADTDPFNDNEKVSFTVQSGDALVDGITYQWRARVSDPAGTASWSDWATARTFTISVPAGGFEPAWAFGGINTVIL